MEIIRLKPGERAPETADRIHINRLPNGRCGWTGSVAHEREAIFGIGENEDRSFGDAEMEGASWAHSHGSVELYIECDHE